MGDILAAGARQDSRLPGGGQSRLALHHPAAARSRFERRDGIASMIQPMIQSIPSAAAPAAGQVAYFSMEIAIDPAIPTYSGGLGVLAGDLLRSAADLALPVTAVTLVSHRGYLRQEIVDGAQVEHRQPWSPVEHAT